MKNGFFDGRILLAALDRRVLDFFPPPVSIVSIASAKLDTPSYLYSTMLSAWLNSSVSLSSISDVNGSDKDRATF